jgi:hypothetical protein
MSWAVMPCSSVYLEGCSGLHENPESLFPQFANNVKILGRDLLVYDITWSGNWT